MVSKRTFRAIGSFTFTILYLLLAGCASNPVYLATDSPAAMQDRYGDFNVQIPDKALLKNYLVVSLQTEPDTICELTYIAPKGQQRVMQETADDTGTCEWHWKIEETDGKGHGRLIFTVNGASDTHFIDIRESF